MTLLHRASIGTILLLLLCQLVSAQEPPERPRGWIGIFLEDEQPAEAEEAGGPPLRPAVAVRAVVEDGPAAEAGLRARDRILAVDGQPVSNVEDLVARVGAAPPGNWLALTIERRGREREMRVHLGARPARTEGLRVVRGWIGASAIDLTPALREHFGAPEDSGVMIAEVVAGGPAEAAGLSVGDVVYEIDGDPVPGAAEMARLVVGAGVGNEVEIAVMRNGTEIVLEALVEAEPR